MAGFTNKGKYRLLGLMRGETLETNFYIALVTSATAPTADINTMSELTQINTGNGYTDGGYQITPGATDMDTWTEDDTGDKALLQFKDITWTASGGPIPSSGSGARYAVLTDDNATVANREIWAYWDLAADRSVSVGQNLTLQNCELDLTET